MMQMCHCKSQKPLSECCGAFLSGHEIPATALELMRSRYSAYTLADMDYLASTTHEDTWDATGLASMREWAERSYWQHLEIVESSEESVEFKAYYIFDHAQHLHHEKSAFLKVNGVWKYLDGEIYEESIEIPRNSACICGSGAKYKQCCLKRIKNG